MLRPLMVIRTLIAQDWRLFWSDARAAIFCFLVPIILASAFGTIFENPSRRLGKMALPVAVVVEDESLLMQSILSDLQASSQLEIKLLSRTEAIARLQLRSPSVVVIFPKGFSDRAPKRWQQGDKPTLELLYHPLAQMESQWAEGLLTEIIVKRFGKAMLGSIGIRDDRAFEKPFEMDRKALPNETTQSFNSYSHSFCGMTVQYLLFWGMESGLLILRERRRGLWRRLRTTPVPLSILLISRAMSMGLIAALQVLITFTFGWLVFDVTIAGCFSTFLLTIIAISFLAAATGLLVATLGGTEARSRSLCILMILGLSMLGGLWLPSFLMPGWVQQIGEFLPTTWAMRLLDGVVWQGHDFVESATALAAVSGFSLLFVSIAVWRFCHTEAQQRLGRCSR
jgi:ABC-2 type transport system permease protein